MRIQMPVELGGEIFDCLDHIPHRVNMLLAKAQKNEDEQEAMEIVLMNLVTNPKITREYLDSDSCNGLVTMLLTEKIMICLDINEDRINEIKKKLVRL